MDGHSPSTGAGLDNIQAFMSDNHHFRIDRARERLLLTMNPNGFLLRVD
jgi:cephalosporin hydroxylase